MNFQKFRAQLDDLSQFFHYLEQRFSEDELSDLDRDILMGYVRDLYKVFFNQNTQQSTPNTQKNIEKPTQENITQVPEKQSIILEFAQPEIIETPVVETPPVIVETPKAEIVETPPVIVETPKVEIVETPPVIVETPKVEIVETAPVIVEMPEPIQEIQPEIVETTAIVLPEVVPPTQETGMVIVQNAVTTDSTPLRPEIVLNTVVDDQMFERSEVHFNPEYDDLFYIKDSKELSQKLADSRIEDLNKAMGLNDKFLYINELFGGNAAKFKMGIDFFNNECKNLNDARAYIERELIEPFKWHSPLKTSLSKDFIKLLRRRYLK